MNILPLARNTDLVVQNADREILIYDLKTHVAFCLNETLTSVYDACDGKTSFDELKKKYKFTDDLIYLSLDELKTNNLLEDYQGNHFGNLSRREAIKKVGMASMIALPIISMLTAPTAAHAASGCRTTGQTGAFTTVGPNTTERLCTNVGYGDTSCCSGVARGTTFTPSGAVNGNGTPVGTCTGITCT